jgi:hypothetical protein
MKIALPFTMGCNGWKTTNIAFRYKVLLGKQMGDVIYGYLGPPNQRVHAQRAQTIFYKVLRASGKLGDRCCLKGEV